MRRILVKLHLWTSLIVALPLFVIGITGALLVYGEELDRVANPEQSYVRIEPPVLPIQSLIDNAKSAYPEEEISGVALPAKSNRSVSVSTTNRRYIFVNPYSAEVLGARFLESGIRRKAFLLHTRLMAGDIGHSVVIVSTFAAIFLTITGIVLWWRLKTWRLRWTNSWRRINFDLHSVFGVYSAVVLLILSLTGVVIAYESVTYPAITRLGGESAEMPPMRSVPGSGDLVTIDSAIAAAEQAVEGARVTYVIVPRNETGVYIAYARFPEDPAEFGRSRVFVDQYRGDVLGVRSTRDAGWAKHMTNIMEAIHFGDIFGLPSQIVALLASVLLGGQVVSGLLIWWKKRNPVRRRASGASKRADTV